MAIRTILTKSNPRLLNPSKPVREINDHILTILDDMIETLHDAQGAGLAAPQVGIARRMVVIDIGDGVIELINPRILSADGAEVVKEGCLSVPGLTGWVERPTRVVISALDRTGTEKTYEGTGLLAQAFMHELDHLDGVLYTEKVIRWCTPEELEEADDENGSEDVDNKEIEDGTQEHTGRHEPAAAVDFETYQEDQPENN